MTAHGKAHPHEKPHHPHWPLAALLFAVVFGLAIFSVHDPATWLHIRTGDLILAKRALPRVDPFSYTVAGRPWTTDSWLSDVLLSLAHGGLGASGLIALKALAAGAAFTLLLPLNPASPLVAAGVLGLGAASAWTGLTETPAVFDLLLLALLIRLLRPRGGLTPSKFFAILGAEVLWANLHGTTAVIGLGLIGLKVFKASLRSEKRELWGYWCLLAASTLALAANPHGLQVIPHWLAGADAWQGAWEPPSAWLSGYGLFVAGGLAACWVCLQQEFVLTTTAAALLAVSLIFPETRPLYILAACPVASIALGHFVLPLQETPARLARWAALMACLLALHGLYLYRPLGKLKGYGTKSLDGALQYLKASGVTGRVFNEPETGAVLIGAGGIPVFVDGRSALYGPAFMKDAEEWPERFRQLSQVYAFDYAVILNRRASYPARVLDEDPDWRLAYADDAALVYFRRRGADGWLVSNLAPRLLTPNRLWPDGLDSALSQPRRLPKAMEEIDRWIVSAPDSAQALLWKAYALGRLKLSQKADRLVSLAQESPRLSWDPELIACLGFVRESRGQERDALRAYLRAAALARRRGDAALEEAALARARELYHPERERR